MKFSRKKLVLSMALLGLTSTMSVNVYAGGTTLPAVPLNWTAGTATVDGNTADWNLSTDASTVMCEAGWINDDGSCNGKEQLSTLYTRYDCNTNTMYVLVLKADGHTADNSASWVKVYTLGNSPRVSGPSNSANFHDVTVGGVVQGYEASFTLAAGTYNDVEVHLEVDGSRTSSTGKIDHTRSIVVPENCTMPAVTPTGSTSTNTSNTTPPATTPTDNTTPPATIPTGNTTLTTTTPAPTTSTPATSATTSTTPATSATTSTDNTATASCPTPDDLVKVATAKTDADKVKADADEALNKAKDAKVDADAKKAKADKDKDDADKAKSDADAKKAKADKDKDDADKAKSDVDVKKAKADKDKDDTDKAKSDADAKKAKADKDKEDADKAKSDADANKVKADKDKADADNADANKAKADKDKADADKAKADADSNKAKADKDKADADKAKADADTNKAKADKDKADADKAKADADTNKAKADKDKADADKAKADADANKAKADKNQEDSNKDNGKSKAQKDKAQKDKEDADKAESDANTNKAKADKAKEDADKAEGDADTNKAKTDKAKADADKAVADTDTNKAKADKAKADADKAVADADANKAKADKAKADADKAKADADADKAKISKAKDDADKADADAAANKDKADKAKADADKTKADADANKDKADKAKADADKAKADADANKDKADKAKADADKAQADADAHKAKCDKDKEDADKVKAQADKEVDDTQKKVDDAKVRVDDAQKKVADAQSKVQSTECSNTQNSNTSGSNTPSGNQKVDVWVSDPTPDTGVEPNTVSKDIWISPDVWLRNQNDGSLQHQNVKQGQDNFVSVRVRNRGGLAAKNTKVEVYYIKASLGRAWPKDWTLVGTTMVDDLAPAGQKIVVIPWTKDKVPGPGHYCFYVRLLNDADPMKFPEGRNAEQNTRNNNNIAWRNFDIVGLLNKVTDKFAVTVQNPNTKPSPINLVFKEPEGFVKQDGAKVRIDLGDLFKRWQDAGGQGENVKVVEGTTQVELSDTPATIIGIPMDSEEELPITMEVDATKPMPVAGESHEYHFSIQEEVDGEVIGGVDSSIVARALDTDTDGDGIKDVDDEDNDNDGIPDAWEIEHDLNPLDTADATEVGPTGVSNLEEYHRSLNADENTGTPGDNTGDNGGTPETPSPWAASFVGGFYNADTSVCSYLPKAVQDKNGNLSGWAMPQWIPVKAWLETANTKGEKTGGLKVKVSSLESAKFCPAGAMTAGSCKAEDATSEQEFTSDAGGKVDFTIMAWWPGVPNDALANSNIGKVENLYSVTVKGGKAGEDVLQGNLSKDVLWTSAMMNNGCTLTLFKSKGGSSRNLR